MNPSPLSIGFIGCGYAAEIHLDALRSVPHAKVVALADIDERARRAIDCSLRGWKHVLLEKPITHNLEDGRRSLQVACAAVGSADSGRAVRVNDAPQT